MKSFKFVKNGTYLIRFIDHNKSEGKNKSSTFCEVIGIYIQSKKHYEVFSWWKTFEDEDFKELDEDNSEYVEIVKSAILSVKQLT